MSDWNFSMSQIQAQIVELHGSGITHVDIGEQLGLATDIVDAQVKKLRRAGVDLSSRPRGSASDWTEDRIAKLKALWHDGKSAGVIAAEMSHMYGCSISRNSIIGKVKRMGLDGRKTTKSRPGARSQSTTPVDWDERRLVILDVQAHSGTYADAGKRLGIAPETARQNAHKLGIPFAPHTNAPSGQRASVSLPRQPRPPRAARQAPKARVAHPEVAAYEAERRANGAMTFIDNPSVGHCKMFLAGESGPYGIQCAASTSGVLDSWCQHHNAIVSVPAPGREQIYASRR